MDKDLRLSSLKGIGEKTEVLFRKAGIQTVGDLIRYYPRAYDLYEAPIPICEVREGVTAAVSGTICSKASVSFRTRLKTTSVYLKDATGTIKAVWYRMPYLRSALSPRKAITLRGRIIRGKDGLVIQHPEIFDPPSKYESKKDIMQPVYPLSPGLTNNIIKRAMLQAAGYMGSVKSYLPPEIEKRYKLEGCGEALAGIHFPKDKESFYAARRRLVFEEFLTFILNIKALKKGDERAKNRFIFKERPLLDSFIEGLPYELTFAQKRAWGEIKADMSGMHVMSRLIQGDVGSGKTIIALLALMFVGLNGYQGAIMAPTEVLAKQHYEKFLKIFKGYGVPLSPCLLTGSMTAKEKRIAYEKISSGEADIIVGTHALIQEKAEYKNLALVVTDEQHRFGVRQRAALAGKGAVPHILVMSATPIPRTLAIILYGDLDISVIDELPKNRLPIKNCVVGTGYRQQAYKFMAEEISRGHQCYIICPMVEASDNTEAENVTDYAETLKGIIKSPVSIACLHGRMKQDEKDRIMEEFAKNKIGILISTTVVEVGIDVPNATVMMIENAERFGLAQLHQLRGRVGRGDAQSYCIFMTPSRKKEILDRLEILNKSNDGFFIASEDLRLRGPGDLFGIRQSGIMDFKLADIYQDAGILKEAAEAAELIEKENPKGLCDSISKNNGRMLSTI